MQRHVIRYERGDGEAAFTAFFHMACSTGRPVIVELEGEAGFALCLVSDVNVQGFRGRMIDAGEWEDRARTCWVERERVVCAYRGPELNG
jgi:hypothetical protein